MFGVEICCRSVGRPKEVVIVQRPPVSLCPQDADPGPMPAHVPSTGRLVLDVPQQRRYHAVLPVKPSVHALSASRCNEDEITAAKGGFSAVNSFALCRHRNMIQTNNLPYVKQASCRAENLEQLSFADNYYVNDEDLHMLYDLETLHSLDFSGCPQVEDSGISVRMFLMLPRLQASV